MDQNNLLQARRQFLKTSGMGLGASALGSLLPQNVIAQTHPAAAASSIMYMCLPFFQSSTVPLYAVS